MNKHLIMVLLALGGLLGAPAWSADVTVHWQDPSKFSDIGPSDQDQASFEANLFKQFDKIFADLGQKLPDSYHWQVTVTDLDLAGEIEHPAMAGGKDVRVVKPVDRPAITFSYTLTDAQGQVVKQDNVDLKDPAFMSRSPTLIGLRVKPFPYEEYMIDRWFDEQQNQKALPSR